MLPKVRRYDHDLTQSWTVYVSVYWCSLVCVYIYSYVQTGCGALKVILRNFAPVIKANMAAPPGLGVDISREER